jgi:hypothetical protein
MYAGPSDVDPCHYDTARLQVVDDRLWTADEGWFSGLGVGRKANNTYRKKSACYEILHWVLKLGGMFKAI